jgi:hypothetical protein
LSEMIDTFSSAVRKEFGFLIEDYGFVRTELERLDFDYPKDKHVRMDYISGFLCVRIEWYLVDATIGIGLIELQDGEMPDRYSYSEKEGFSRAISLRALIEFLTDGALQDPLPSARTASSARAITRAWRERAELINESMEALLATYSGWLRGYAGDILRDDTLIFERVQRYEEQTIANRHHGQSTHCHMTSSQ